MLEHITQLGVERVVAKALEIKGRLLRDTRFMAPLIRSDHPPLLLMLQAAYEEQLYMEGAALLLSGEKRWPEVRTLLRRWRGGLVRLYERTKDLYTVLIWGTARDQCVLDEIAQFLLAFAELNASARNGYPQYVLITGGSQTGAMGKAIEAYKLAHGPAAAKALVKNVILGFTEGSQQTEMASVFGENSPPFFSFITRLYAMALLGRRVGRIVLNGGAGTFDELVTEMIEAQMSKRVLTVHTAARSRDPIPPIVTVNSVLPDGGFFWDGADRQVDTMSLMSTLPRAELPPMKTLVLHPTASTLAHFASHHGVQHWKATHGQNMVDPQEAARQVIAVLDDSFRRMVA